MPRNRPSPITSYRHLRRARPVCIGITTKLNDAVAGAAIRACCHRGFFLKRRLWSVEGLEPDAAGQKSIIPCLEPCAILLEFARKMARLEQQEAAAAAAETGSSGGECDFDSPDNARRKRFNLEKQRGAVKPQAGHK